jgi:hypothetical protein
MIHMTVTTASVKNRPESGAGCPYPLAAGKVERVGLALAVEGARGRTRHSPPPPVALWGEPYAITVCRDFRNALLSRYFSPEIFRQKFCCLNLGRGFAP